MSKIHQNATELVGATPLLQLSNLAKKYNINANIIGKLESFNLAGSVKDRIALAMIKDAEEKGLLSKGSVIIEPTSSNTGIGLAAIASAKGYPVIFTMPDTMSIERRALLKAYGADLVLTEGSKGMRGAIEKAEALTANTPNAFMPGQFSNPANPEMHRKTTGPEIWNDTNGLVDIFVAGVGTGGTITGAGGYLKSKNPNLHIVAVEPVDSPVLSGGAAAPHKIQGIGAGFVPSILNTSIYDQIIKVASEDAFAIGRDLAQTEGLLVGISSGAAVWAAMQLAQNPDNAGKNIVVILPDTGERYLSTAMFTTIDN